MRGFVLPSLHSSTEESPWRSKIILPPPIPVELLEAKPKVFLPSVRSSHHWQKIRELTAEVNTLEAARARERLESKEKEIRVAICGREREGRYRVLWSYQEEKARVERETAATLAKALAEQRLQYVQNVNDLRERGHVLHLETVARTLLRSDEANERIHITSLFDVALLEKRRREAVLELGSSESILLSLKCVRNLECRVAKAAYHPSISFTPRTQLSYQLSSGRGGYRGRSDLLMDYTVCEEEWDRRLCIISEERVTRVPLEWQRSVMQITLMEEPLARAALEELCLYGSCQTRLRSLTRIQRWWRMLRSTPWKMRTQMALQKCVATKRYNMTSRDFSIILQRMLRNSTTLVKVPSLKEVRKSMAALERALELCYKNVFEYSIYGMLNCIANLQDTEIHRLRSNQFDKNSSRAEITSSSFMLLCMPNRIYVRHIFLEPYAIWRSTRWIEGSASFMRHVQLYEEAETRARELLLQREKKDSDVLFIYKATLKGGTWAWRSLYTSLLFFQHEEETYRGFIQECEQENRATIAAEASSHWLTFQICNDEKWYLQCEELQQREAIVEEESQELVHLTDSEWRWENLLRLRVEFKKSCGGKFLWMLSRDHGKYVKFSSLDSTARVIQRFWRMAHSRFSGAKVKCQIPVANFRETANDLTSLLIAQFTEDKQALRPNGHVGCLTEPILETAVKLFNDMFDGLAQLPMEREYKEIVARFLAENREWYEHLHFLFHVVGFGRERIQHQESCERDALFQSEPYSIIVRYQLCMQEEEQRRKIESECAEEHSSLGHRFQLLTTLVECTTTKYDVRRRPVSSTEIPKILQSLFRTPGTQNQALCVQYHEGEKGDQEVKEKEETEEEKVKTTSKCAETRISLGHSCPVDNPLVISSLSLERECITYAERLLFPAFLRGMLNFANEAKYFDRKLSELLLRRVSYIRSKIREIEAAEVYARGRIEYMEETHRCLNLCFYTIT